MTAEDKETEVRSSRPHLILTSWASVATALFLFTLIFGAVYVINIKPECDNDTNESPVTTKTDTEPVKKKTDDTRHVTLKLKDGDNEESEDIHQDNTKHTDFIIKRNSDGNIDVIAGIDYQRKISACYLPRDNVCVLATGDDLAWYEDVDDSKTRNTTVDVTKDDEAPYKVNLKNKVSDLSLLTEEMRPICRGKDMYWATKDDDNSVGEREKRGYCCRYYYYYYRCYRYYYGYWYLGWCKYYYCYYYYCYG